MPTITWPAQPAARPAKHDPPTRFVAGSAFVRLKNIHLIIDVFNQLTAAGMKASLVVFGRSDELGESGYQREVEVQSQFNPAIRIMDWDPAWTNNLTGVDIFRARCLRRILGIVILEAFARGCRIVVPRETFLDDLPEPLKSDGVVRVERMDTNTLAGAMKAAAATPAESSGLWELRRSARDRFSAQVAGSRFAVAYASL